MDKVNIYDLGAKIPDPFYIQIGEATVEVFPFPKTSRLIDVIQETLEFIITESPVISAPMKKIFLDLSVVSAFTNIEVSYDKKTAQDVYEMYDLIKASGILETIYLRCSRVDFLQNGIIETIDDIISYRRSLAGTVDTLVSEAKDDTTAFEQAEKLLTDPNQIQNVKNLLATAEKLSTPSKKE